MWLWSATTVVSAFDVTCVWRSQSTGSIAVPHSHRHRHHHDCGYCRHYATSITTETEAANDALPSPLSSSSSSSLPTTTTTSTTTATPSTTTTTTATPDRHRIKEVKTTTRTRTRKSPLSMSLSELAVHVQGTGRAQLAWDCYRYGIDPVVYFGGNHHHHHAASTTTAATTTTTTRTTTATEDTDTTTTQQQQQQAWKFPSRRRNQTLGFNALERLSQLYVHQDDDDNNNDNDPQNNNVISHHHQPPHNQNIQSLPTIESSIASLTLLTQSHDGTTKLLLTLARDQTQIETVLIPFFDPENRTTICLSSQVGCQQACTFCATGTMGKTRSLTSDEIMVQYFYAQQIIHQTSSPPPPALTTTTNRDIGTMHRMIPPITNVVFMGMGEPSDNADAVLQAVTQFTTRELCQLAARKVTVSTVAPSPDAFAKFAAAPCVLAWSVHAATDPLRKRLVPTTRYTLHELRQGLIDALLIRPPNFLRTVMIEVALMDQINDSIQDADDMATLVRGITDAVPACKVMVNLIPYNDIHRDSDNDYGDDDDDNNDDTDNDDTALFTFPSSTPAAVPPRYRPPRREQVVQYQRHLWSRGVYTHVRETRGDNDSAACGQLVTRSTSRNRNRSRASRSIPTTTTTTTTTEAS